MNTTAKKIGRPLKLTSEWLTAFEVVINEGLNSIILTDEELLELTNDQLAIENQLSKRTFERYKTKDREKGPLKEFWRLYKKALIVQKRSLFTKMEEDPKAWQRYAWILERRFDEWNLKKQISANISETKQDVKQITGMEII